MKRLIVIICFALFLSSISGMGRKPDEKVIINISQPSIRLTDEEPEAIISGKQLRISFKDLGAYTLSVENESNEVEFIAVLSADGTVYSFDLSVLDDGYYRLVLEGPAGEYEGYFFID